MNDIKQGSILTLNDNVSYVVVSKATIDNIMYLYMMQKANIENNIYCKCENEKGNIKITPITDKDLIIYLIPKLYETGIEEANYSESQ